jgi:MFS family permease
MRQNYKWAVVGMLWFICFFNYADRQAIFSVFPRLKAEFGFDAVQLGLIGSAFAWVYAAGAPLAGFIADRVSRKKLILGGCAFWSLVTLLTGSCGRLWQFVAVRALEGLGETFYFPATMSLLSDYHGRRTRSRAMAWHQSSVYAGTIGGSWFGAWLAETHGWRSGFYVFGGLGLALAVVLARFLREPPRNSEEPETPERAAALGARETWREIFRRPAAWLLMLAFLGANFVATIFLTWTPTFLTEKFGFRLTTAGLSGSLFIHLASAISVPIGGWLADAWSGRWAAGRILVQAVGLAVGAGFIVLVGLTRDVTTLLVAMTFFGLSKGLYDSNIFAALYDAIAPRARASAAGVMNTVGWGGGALGPLAVGLATKYGRHASDVENMSEALAFGGGIYLLAAAVLVLAARATMRKKPEDILINP